MKDTLDRLTEKKQKIDNHRPLPSELTKNLEDWFRVELTYTSNAIEGNTLSRQETALVVEKGITVDGKTVKDHLEAINHAQALEFIKTLVNKKRGDVTQADILDLHRSILTKIDDANAGRYRAVAVRIAGSRVILPNALKVPELMDEYTVWLHTSNTDHPVTIAADAHFKFVSIHPFVDGNGRCGRLLMNLLLLQAGYPPAFIRKEDRKRYITSIEQAQLGGSLDEYYKLMYEAVERSLDIYLEALEPKEATKGKHTLLKIGALARGSGETVHSIRFWTKEGLLTVANITKGGYQLYDPSMIEKVKEIRRLQNEQRLTLKEIKERI